jgi:GNAT superfamily N-acetyltransferase
MFWKVVMKRKNIPMSWAEYELMEHPFGWKVEYWDGQTRLTPRGMGVTTRIALSPRSLQQDYTLTSAHPDYTEQLIAGYMETFVDSVEFCDWPLNDIQDSANKCIHHYFAGKRGEPLPASVIALEPDSQTLAGVALFILNREQKPLLDLLYVRPEFQRKGMGTAMVSWGVNHLLESDFQELLSAYHICNDQSCQWHHRFGFQDIYDRFYIRLKVAWYNNEIWRREQLGLLEGIDVLMRERDEWQSKVAEDDYY